MRIVVTFCQFIEHMTVTSSSTKRRLHLGEDCVLKVLTFKQIRD